MLTGLKRKLSMLFWGDIVPENKEIRGIDAGDIIRSYVNNNIMVGVDVVDLQMMFSDLYNLVTNERYLLSTKGNGNDYEFLYKAIIYYIDKAHKENDDEFFQAIFYGRYEISRDRLQAHFPTLDDWQLDGLLQIVNCDYTVPVEELEEDNILVYIARVREVKERIAI
jgi:hypothetical protein